MFNKAMGNEFRIGPIKRIPSISLSAFYGSYKAALKLEASITGFMTVRASRIKRIFIFT